MAKKKPKKIDPKERFLEVLIHFSERAITNKGYEMDTLFRQQADRLKKQLDELRIKNELRKDL